MFIYSEVQCGVIAPEGGSNDEVGQVQNKWMEEKVMMIVTNVQQMRTCGALNKALLLVTPALSATFVSFNDARATGGISGLSSKTKK